MVNASTSTATVVGEANWVIGALIHNSERNLVISTTEFTVLAPSTKYTVPTTLDVTDTDLGNEMDNVVAATETVGTTTATVGNVDVVVVVVVVDAGTTLHTNLPDFLFFTHVNDLADTILVAPTRLQLLGAAEDD